MNPEPAPPFGIIACDVLEMEVVERLRRLNLEPREVRFLEMGKHDFPSMLREDLQATIRDCEDSGCERLIFVYGLCSNSILGLVAQKAEMIFPRAHDCITLFLGHRQRYAEIQKETPGTYWFSPGWCRGQRVPGPDHFERVEAAFREKFDDEEDVAYLMEMEREKYALYRTAAFTDLGDGPIEESRADTQKAAAYMGMEFVHHPGDDRLLNQLLTGPWNSHDFLVVPPGETIRHSADDAIIQCTACQKSTASEEHGA